MIKSLSWLIAAVLVISVVACGRAEPKLDLAAYEAEIMEWRAGRLERLLAPNGYLTQIGLHWLDERVYTIGSDPDNDIVVPATAAARIGELRVGTDGVWLFVEEGVEVLHEGEPISEILMGADTSENPVMVTHRSLAWSIIERDGPIAVRIRDYEHPFVDTFGPLPYFEIDPAYRFAAELKSYDEPRTVAVDTVIEGFQQFPVAPGIVTFELNGQRYELEPTIAGDKLFFVFGDDTNRDATYGAGRFLYADAPGEDGRLVLDFNKSYSPPCAFNDFSTCPVASPRNRISIRIEAGEKFAPNLHYSGAAAH
jgi:uncharacterized protein (DUF1684 family)